MPTYQAGNALAAMRAAQQIQNIHAIGNGSINQSERDNAVTGILQSVPSATYSMQPPAQTNGFSSDMPRIKQEPELGSINPADMMLPSATNSMNGKKRALSTAQYTNPKKTRNRNDIDLDNEAINSDLDDSDDDALRADGDDADEGDVQTVLCLYDKVQRTKNKWKCVLKDGIVSINNRDYAFNKANGEFEW